MYFHSEVGRDQGCGFWSAKTQRAHACITLTVDCQGANIDEHESGAKSTCMPYC